MEPRALNHHWEEWEATTTRVFHRTSRSAAAAAAAWVYIAAAASTIIQQESEEVKQRGSDEADRFIKAKLSRAHKL